MARIIGLKSFLIVLFSSSTAIIQCPSGEFGVDTDIYLCSIGQSYDRNYPNSPFPQNVTTSVTMYSVAELDDVLQTINIDIRLAMTWTEPRLTINGYNDPNVAWYHPTADETKQLYLPSIKFSQVKQIKREVKYGPLEENYFWFVNQVFEFQQTLKLTIYCPFHFTDFPFDSHECFLDFGDDRDLSTLTQLLPPTIEVNGTVHAFGQAPIKMNQTRLPFDIHLESLESFTHYEAGNVFSYTGIGIYLKRNKLGVLVGSFYLPTLIFTCLSLISFTIHADVVPGRLGLLITLYLIASNVYHSVKGPPSRGFSYIEVWMVGVHIPMLTAIFEYGFLLAIKKKFRKFVGNIDEFCDKVDTFSFVFSFSFIVVFNLIYWTLSYLK